MAGRGELTPCSSPRKNADIFYFLHIIKFVNSEFIFAIKDPKLYESGHEHTLNKAQNRELFFYMHP